MRRADPVLESGRRPADGEASRRFAYGFDLRVLRATALRDRHGTITIQDRCYDGGCLGTSDPASVCTQEENAFFWDMVHPTSDTHCWLAFFVERDLTRADLLAAEPDAVAYRRYCARRQEATTPAAARRDAAEVSAP